MKICYVADPEIIITIRYLKFFVNKGAKVFIIPSMIHPNKNSEQIRIDGVEILDFHDSKNKEKTLNYLKIINNYLNHISPDIIHVMNYSKIGFLTSICGKGKVPIVFTPWGGDLLLAEKYSIYYRISLRLFLRIITSQFAGSMTMHLKAVQYGLIPEKCVYLDLGINTDKFHPNLDTKKIRSKLRISKSTKVVLVPRQWSKKQNTELILRSVPYVLEQFPDTIFVFKNVVGTLGPSLHRIRAELKLEHSVYLIDRDLPAEESYEELPQYYNLAAITISIPNWDAGAPYTVSESMACGSIPIVSPANSVWVKNQVNGLIINPISISTISQAIIHILNEPEWIHPAKSFNYQLIKWGLGFENNMNEIYENYTKLSRKQDD